MMSDADEIRRALGVLMQPGDVLEMRALGTHVGTVSGYFDDPEALTREAVAWSGKATAVYVTLNPCLPDLLARAANRAKRHAKTTTSDHEIACRHWLGVDFDPVRPADISSTEEEHAAALDRARECREWLREEAWPEPIFADSGNGAHLVYPVDDKNDDAARARFERVLKRIAEKMDDARVTVDRKTFNASRIWKLYGTLARKGDDIPARPYRLARIVELPE